MKKDRNQTADYYSDLIELLLANKRFSEEILKLRKELGIPSRGLPASRRAAWIVRTWPVSDIPEIERRRFDHHLQVLPPVRSLFDLLGKLASKFNLDWRWYLFLYTHLVGGSKSFPSSPSVQVEPKYNDSRLPYGERHVTRLSLVLSKDATLEDVAGVMKTVRMFQKEMVGHMPARRKPLSNKKRYLQIRHLEDKGLTHSQISDQLGIDGYESIAAIKRDIEKRFEPSNEK